MKINQFGEKALAIGIALVVLIFVKTVVDLKVKQSYLGIITNGEIQETLESKHENEIKELLKNNELDYALVKKGEVIESSMKLISGTTFISVKRQKSNNIIQQTWSESMMTLLPKTFWQRGKLYLAIPYLLDGDEEKYLIIIKGLLFNEKK